MVINYVTKNKAKFESAKQYFKDFGIDVNQIKMDTIEIQSDSGEEIASYSAKYASEKLNLPVIKNDTGFYVEALSGFPGPYSHYVEDKIGFQGLLDLMKNKKNRKAYFLEVFAYAEPNCELKLFLCKTIGTISYEPCGEFGWGWDYVFIPENCEKTLACFDDNERYKKWNNTGFEQIKNFLINKNSV